MEPRMTRSVPTTASSSWRLEDYLDHVCVPLVGLLPYAARQELRAELQAHLEADVAAHREMGSTPGQAIAAALQQFGDPHRLGQHCAREWTRAAGPPSRQPAWPAMLKALLCFGTASMFALVALPALSGASAFSPQWSVWMGVVFVGVLPPLLAGLITGLWATARHALGTFFALSSLILLFILAYLVASPAVGAENRLVLALAQVTYWIPLGCGAAALGGSPRRRRPQGPRPWALP
jgi:hypothetical protein